MHTYANIHAYATLSIIYYYKTYNYNNNFVLLDMLLLCIVNGTGTDYTGPSTSLAS
jgi:hypothetical protein